jgi:release factor glutamine methyltransferase
MGDMVMNERSPLAISTWLDEATKDLVAKDIPSARLDAEIILAHTLRKSRAFLHAHGDEIMSAREHEIADARLLLRLDRTPIAYIIGHKEFYGRRFRVTPATLIPRPESETIITILKELTAGTIPLLKDTSPKLVDVGTGSGCLGITAKLEIPELDVTLLDISKHALKVTEFNSKALDADVIIILSDLLAAFPFAARFILANLPYVDPAWERSPETNYEPEIALFAKDHGLSLINKLIDQAPAHLVEHGMLLLEADPRQHTAIITYAKKHGFSHSKTQDFVIVLKKT